MRMIVTGKSRSGKSSALHRLVRTALQATWAHTLLADANPRNPSRRDRWARYLALRPHVEVSRAVESRDPRVQELISALVKFLYYWGDHPGSEQLAEEPVRSTHRRHRR